MMGDNHTEVGDFRSPGGFVFGVQGWSWGEQRPTGITFLLNGSCKVYDQHGRPIKGTVKDNVPLYFEKCSHATVIKALAEERIDWQRLTCAGWPQLPYEELKKVQPLLPPTPIDDLKKITDAKLRRDALKVRREMVEAEQKEAAAISDE